MLCKYWKSHRRVSKSRSSSRATGCCLICFVASRAQQRELNWRFMFHDKPICSACSTHTHDFYSMCVHDLTQVASSRFYSRDFPKKEKKKHIEREKKSDLLASFIAHFKLLSFALGDLIPPARKTRLCRERYSNLISRGRQIQMMKPHTYQLNEIS